MEGEKKRLEQLFSVLDQVRHVCILIYGNPDPDGLASAWALRELLHVAGVTAVIRYTGEVGRLENRAMIDLLRIPAAPLKAAELAGAARIALVDAQPEFFTDRPLPRCDIVFDHHPRKSGRKHPFADIRARCLATSSILTSYLIAARTAVHSRLATALYYGIQTDGRNLQRAPSPMDVTAVDFLLPRVNRPLLRRIESSSYSLARLDYFTIALVRLRYAHNVLYSHIGPVPSADVCVQVADFLVRVKEANWALVSGVVGTRLIIVFRCDGLRKHAGRAATMAFGSRGSAGGHTTMGRAEIDQAALPAGIMLTQSERLERFILQSLARVEPGFGPLSKAITRSPMS